MNRNQMHVAAKWRISQFSERLKESLGSRRSSLLNSSLCYVMHHSMARGKETEDTEKEKFSHEAMTHLDHLYRVALYLAKKSDEAKDLVQETYSRALGSYKQFTPGTNMKAWLTTILYNFFFHDRKQKKKWILEEDSFAQDEEPSDYWEKVPTENPGPEIHILLKELKGKITDVLNKIPEEFRLPIILVIMGDFSYEEAAEILSCPVGTIRSRLFRGRKLVYKELGEYIGIKEKSERKK
jgi:RNA polymerase sigma-70 factor (ECF subfamily)